MSVKKVAQGAKIGDPMVEEESIDKIREILFGSTQRGLETKSRDIEKRIEKEGLERAQNLKKLRESLERRIDKVRDDLRGRLDQLSERLKEGEATAKQDLADSTAEIRDEVSELDQRITAELDGQSDALKKAIEDLGEEFFNTVEQLDNAKADRVDLGELFVQIGTRLKGTSGSESEG
jgi:gas vesicle protein